MTSSQTVHLMEAIAFAADKHRHQRRKDKEASPYINHPIALAHLLVATAGVEDPVVLQAAILHDTIEDTQTSYAELLDRFGKEVADVVAEVTDDKSLPKERRKELQVEHAPHASRAAALVKLADKICNLRDMAAAPPHGWSLQRRQEYFDWAKRVVDRLPPVSDALSAAFTAAYAAKP
jgi:guanosine-3',5'-bis(diphosphate) 3'-pyrophosphohydrolase